MIKIKNNKLILSFILLLILPVFMTGCGTSKKTASEEIKTEMEKKGYIAEEKDFEIVGVKNTKTAYTFTDKKHKYTIEYCDYKDKKNAKKKYEIIFSLYESYGDDKVSDDSSTGENNERYEILTSDKYSVISRINNSIIYASVPKKYKTNVEEVLESFGY